MVSPVLYYHLNTFLSKISRYNAVQKRVTFRQTTWSTSIVYVAAKCQTVVTTCFACNVYRVRYIINETHKTLILRLLEICVLCQFSITKLSIIRGNTIFKIILVNMNKNLNLLQWTHIMLIQIPTAQIYKQELIVISFKIHFAPNEILIYVVFFTI